MKPEKNIEEFVKSEKPHVTTGGAMDERTLTDSFEAMDETIRANKPSAAGTILRSRAARLAAAAVIIVAVGLLMVYRNPGEQQQPQTVSAAKSPVEMMTTMSLTIAYRKGGMEAVEEQYSEAFKLIGPRPESLSVKHILAEFNGT
ncbi:MAG: hypothetical protein D4R45_03615 [Planctomycetaceae bacterium]|nr:MAG: hypothetical protein D4R45_03615 [Planctomycetaceae bacterium]